MSIYHQSPFHTPGGTLPVYNAASYNPATSRQNLFPGDAASMQGSQLSEGSFSLSGRSIFLNNSNQPPLAKLIFMQAPACFENSMPRGAELYEKVVGEKDDYWIDHFNALAAGGRPAIRLSERLQEGMIQVKTHVAVKRATIKAQIAALQQEDESLEAMITDPEDVYKKVEGIISYSLYLDENRQGSFDPAFFASRAVLANFCKFPAIKDTILQGPSAVGTLFGLTDSVIDEMPKVYCHNFLKTLHSLKFFNTAEYKQDIKMLKSASVQFLDSQFLDTCIYFNGAFDEKALQLIVKIVCKQFPSSSNIGRFLPKNDNSAPWEWMELQLGARLENYRTAGNSGVIARSLEEAAQGHFTSPQAKTPQATKASTPPQGSNATGSGIKLRQEHIDDWMTCYEEANIFEERFVDEMPTAVGTTAEDIERHLATFKAWLVGDGLDGFIERWGAADASVLDPAYKAAFVPFLSDFADNSFNAWRNKGSPMKA